jgi:uridine kinase
VSSQADVERRWRERYIPSQQLYFATVRPTDLADIIVHNDEPQQPDWKVQTRERAAPARPYTTNSMPSCAAAMSPPAPAG